MWKWQRFNRIHLFSSIFVAAPILQLSTSLIRYVSDFGVLSCELQITISPLSIRTINIYQRNSSLLIFVHILCACVCVVCMWRWCHTFSHLHSLISLEFSLNTSVDWACAKKVEKTTKIVGATVQICIRSAHGLSQSQDTHIKSVSKFMQNFLHGFLHSGRVARHFYWLFWWLFEWYWRIQVSRCISKTGFSKSCEMSLNAVTSPHSYCTFTALT